MGPYWRFLDPKGECEDMANKKVHLVWKHIRLSLHTKSGVLSEGLIWNYIEFPLAPMGVLAPVSAHAGPSAQPPIGTSGKFPARVSAELPSNISPNPSEVISKVSEVYDNF